MHDKLYELFGIILAGMAQCHLVTRKYYMLISTLRCNSESWGHKWKRFSGGGGGGSNMIYQIKKINYTWHDTTVIIIYIGKCSQLSYFLKYPFNPAACSVQYNRYLDTNPLPGQILNNNKFCLRAPIGCQLCWSFVLGH